MSEIIREAAEAVIRDFGRIDNCACSNCMAIFVKAVKKLESALAEDTLRCPGDSGHSIVEKDLSMLVRRLCRRLRHSLAEQDKAMIEQALDYLKRKGLQGSVLRESAIAEDIDRWIPVAERLPEHPRDKPPYLCYSQKVKYVEICHHFKRGAFWHPDGDSTMLSQVSHWKPISLPSPQK